MIKRALFQGYYFKFAKVDSVSVQPTIGVIHSKES